MAGNGRVPDPSTRRRRNKEERTELEGASEARKRMPALGPGFRSETRAWWASWAKSPQAAMFTETAWTRLRMVAKLVDRFHDPETPASLVKELLGEIRLNESLMGATPADLQRLKWDVRQPTDTGTRKPATAKAATKRAAERKDRVLKLVPHAEAG